MTFVIRESEGARQFLVREQGPVVKQDLGKGWGTSVRHANRVT